MGSACLLTAGTVSEGSVIAGGTLPLFVPNARACWVRLIGRLVFKRIASIGGVAAMLTTASRTAEKHKVKATAARGLKMPDSF
jgi:hypothetical protein